MSEQESGQESGQVSEQEKEAIEILETLSCYGLGLVITDENIQAIDIVLDYIDKLQKENEEYHRIKKELIRVNKKIYDVDTIDEFIKTIDKLQKELEEKTTILMAGANKVKQLEKENKELKEENIILEGNKIGYKLAIQELKEENKKISKAADKMYEYISYYGWEDFESNTGCNREEMVDYFYKE